MTTLETYQKLEILNSYLDGLKGKGRPPKWYKMLCEFLHYNNYVLMFETMNMYDYIEDAKHFLNNTNAGMVNEIYYHTGLD